MTLSSAPEILAAKLAAGFPHVGLAVPAAHVEAKGFDLCRYNIARMRSPKRGEAEGIAESPADGRYYEPFQVPVARDARDQRAMLHKHGTDRIIEVLVDTELPLSDETQVMVYSRDDADIVWSVLNRVGREWQVVHRAAPGQYEPWSGHVLAVHRYVRASLADPTWRGDGLEFDRLRRNPLG